MRLNDKYNGSDMRSGRVLTRTVNSTPQMLRSGQALTRTPDASSYVAVKACFELLRSPNAYMRISIGNNPTKPRTPVIARNEAISNHYFVCKTIYVTDSLLTTPTLIACPLLKKEGKKKLVLLNLRSGQVLTRTVNSTPQMLRSGQALTRTPDASNYVAVGACPDAYIYVAVKSCFELLRNPDAYTRKSLLKN